MNDFDFKDLEKRRPLWKDIGYFLGFTLFLYGVVHVGLNSNAYTQIASFKYGQLKASVLEVTNDITLFEPAEIVVEEKLEKVNAKAAPKTFRQKNLQPRNQASQVFKDMKIYPSDNRLYIPRINKNVPLITVPQHQNWNQLEKNIQSGLQEGVVVHPVSHSPGNFGNFFLTGHSSYYTWDEGRFKDVFALLHEVKETARNRKTE
jgi:sortase (surface protein transpeptidase)